MGNITYVTLARQKIKNVVSMLNYIPECSSAKEKDAIMQEVRLVEKDIMRIKEMHSKKQKEYVKWKIMTIESDINNN